MDAKLRAQSLIEFGLPRNWIALVIERLTRGGAAALTSNELYMIFKRAGNLLRVESSVIDVHTECRVVGNLYGKVDSLRSIFRNFGWPSEVCYVFLGDYITVEGDNIRMDMFILLLIFKIVYPKRILLLRGSAECEHCAAEMGLMDLLLSTFTVSLYQVLKDIFKYLPLAAQVNSVYLLSNTSLNLDRGTLVDLELIVRPCTTCPLGQTLRSLSLKPPRLSEENEENESSPVLTFMRRSGLLVSIRNADKEVPSDYGCHIDDSRHDTVSIVSATTRDGEPFNGTVLAIHRNSVSTFHSVDPKAAKPHIRLLMPLPLPAKK